LAYTQIVTFAVYSFLLARLFSDQYIPDLEGQLGDETAYVNRFFPLFTMLKVFF